MAEKLRALSSLGCELRNHIAGKVSEKEIDQLTILLNVISGVSLQLEDLFDRDYKLAPNPYKGMAIWFEAKG